MLTFLILSLGAISPALAQESTRAPIPPALVSALDHEPPLNQADVDAYIRIIPEIIPELAKLFHDPQSAEQLAAGLNLSQIRFYYIMAKVPLTMALASGVDPKNLGLDSLPKALSPSSRELRLVKNNLKALNEAAEEASRALSRDR